MLMPFHYTPVPLDFIHSMVQYWGSKQ